MQQQGSEASDGAIEGHQQVPEGIRGAQSGQPSGQARETGDGWDVGESDHIPSVEQRATGHRKALFPLHARATQDPLRRRVGHSDGGEQE
jgi:hypothetical protein